MKLVMRIDLARDRRAAICIQVMALVAGAAMIGLGFVIRPGGETGPNLIWRILATVAGVVAYTIAHEAVHGACMWLFGRKKPHFGFSLAYAYAGSDALLGKAAYLVTALAPMIFWGAALAALTAAVPAGWFWVVYTVQAYNVAGSMGDVYVSLKVARLPGDIRVKDSGTAMSIYRPGKV